MTPVIIKSEDGTYSLTNNVGGTRYMTILRGLTLEQSQELAYQVVKIHNAAVNDTIQKFRRLKSELSTEIDLISGAPVIDNHK